MRPYRILLAITLFAHWTGLSAQTWCPPGATWWFGFNYGQSYGYKMYTYTGDSLLDGYTAQKITAEVHAHYLNPPQDVVYMEDPFLTRVEDGVLYRWQTLFMQTPNEWDTLIWFSASPGDHWDGLQPDDFECYSRYQVTDTGHVAINGLNLRYVRTYYPDEYGDTWYYPVFIERIGCVYGTFLDACGLPVADLADTTLRCYQDADFAYSVPNAPPCDLVTGIGMEPQPAAVAVFPNPGTSGFTMDAPAGLGDWLELTNATGRVVLATRFTGTRKLIPAAHLAAGTYVWTLRNGHNAPVSRGRWMKE
ncbi:MAG: T9SS type A sorting domain-containing protein [Bacteroidetes bacterium]|nr:T9SS type A sorting domain-containing protein [Bacteroidota bacterium]